jgi:hypothetical protein
MVTMVPSLSTAAHSTDKAIIRNLSADRTFAGSQKPPAFEVDGCVPLLQLRGLPLKDCWLIKGIGLACSGFEGARSLCRRT